MVVLLVLLNIVFKKIERQFAVKFQHVILTLMKLHLNLSFDLLSDLFCFIFCCFFFFSRCTAARIFYTVLGVYFCTQHFVFGVTEN